MKALRWHGPEDVRLDELAIPEPSLGEVLVKIGAATTCGTDFKTFKRGHPRLIKEIPANFGHEMAGVIEKCGEGVENFQEGDRVVIGNSAPCKKCFYCKKQEFSLCEDLFFLNGAYAEYIQVPQRIVEANLHKIPSSLSFSQAALSEPLACVLHAFEKLNPQKGEQLALLGAGPMGVLFVQLAKLYGVSLVALGRDRSKLENLKNLGAKEVVSLTEDEDAVLLAKSFLNEGRGADMVIEAVGLPETWELATQLARPGGRVCFYGGCQKGSQVQLDTYALHYQELKLFGVFHHTPHYFARAVQLLSEKKICAEGLIVGEYSLGEYQKVFQKGLKSHPLKYAIIP
ncbi:MAG: alcohol dehydrogenase catalytic domain-containing protein [Deltaproteobacteria bacterium]|nr:alcohol dehydrogenase catalytic domain-containing protein [Deltaproteobacteria bacterium]